MLRDQKMEKNKRPTQRQKNAQITSLFERKFRDVHKKENPRSPSLHFS